MEPHVKWNSHLARFFDAEREIECGNIGLIQNFLGGIDEEWFILIHVDIERKAAPATAILHECVAARDPEELVQRGHHYAMVDEVDSVLIDEARTPLIISGPIPRGDEHEFYDLKPRINKVVDAQKKLVNQYLNDAKKLLGEGNEKEGGLPLFRAYRAMPKYKPLIKMLSETGNKAVLQKTENFYLQKDGEKLKRPRTLNFRKDMTEYLSDCPSLVEKIRDKDFKRKDLEFIVLFYNKQCK